MIWRNSEGYYDPTAGGAINNIMKEERTMEIMRGDIYYTIRNNPESDIRQAALAKSLMMAHDLQMRFVTAPDYISLVGDSYKRERGEEDKSQIYRTCKLLVLDDIGSQIDKEWQRQELFRLTNYRIEHGGITIYTSNLATSSLNVDDRTKDRIIKSSIIIQMPEESIRRKRAAEEQDKFLQSILREGA